MSFSSYRGRLINPFLAVLHRLDTASTAANPGAGGYTQGYDPDFREPVLMPPVGVSGYGASNRKEFAAIKVPAQFERIKDDALMPHMSGHTHNKYMKVVFHFSDLSRLGLIDATSKRALIKAGDRISDIRNIDDTDAYILDESIFCIEAMPEMGGLGNRINLLICTFETRKKSS